MRSPGCQRRPHAGHPTGFVSRDLAAAFKTCFAPVLVVPGRVEDSVEEADLLLIEVIEARGAGVEFNLRAIPGRRDL